MFTKRNCWLEEKSETKYDSLFQQNGIVAYTVLDKRQSNITENSHQPGFIFPTNQNFNFNTST